MKVFNCNANDDDDDDDGVDDVDVLVLDSLLNKSPKGLS